MQPLIYLIKICILFVVTGKEDFATAKQFAASAIF